MTISRNESQRPLISGQPDLDAVVATLTIAFWEDPIMTWAIPLDTVERTRYMDAFFGVTTRLLLDHGGLVASSANYDAVLVWSGANDAEVTDEENLDFLGELEESTGPCGGRLRTLMEALDDHHPADLPPHCHMLFAAVRPEARGSGARAALTEARRDLQYRDGVGVYGEASSNRSLRLWQRLGFERVGSEIRLPEGGPSLYPIFAAAPSII